MAATAALVDRRGRVQHFADPDAVPLELIPELFDLLFGSLEPPNP